MSPSRDPARGTGAEPVPRPSLVIALLLTHVLAACMSSGRDEMSGDASETGGASSAGTVAGEAETTSSEGTESGSTSDAPTCGDGTIDAGEQCDDGNTAAADGCETDCTVTPGVAGLGAGSFHTCAITFNGGLRCWGSGLSGLLGYGATENVGDDEAPSAVGDVPLDTIPVRVVGGARHTCVLAEEGVRCWGDGELGALGYANTETLGDDETAESAGTVDVGGVVNALVPLTDGTCALLEGGTVRCWGSGAFGVLGRGNTDTVGDDEAPGSVDAVDVGGTVVGLSASGAHVCALIEGGGVRCWGYGGLGRLGYGNEDNVGDDETPANAGDVNLGEPALDVQAGGAHTCVLLAGGRVRCWGWGENGQLGTATTENIGDDEEPANAPDVILGEPAVRIAARGDNTCAVLAGARLRCWGGSTSGQTGYGSTENVGDDEAPADAGDVDVGEPIVDVVIGGSHVCALTETANLRCWGFGLDGQLGYGNTANIGDDELPSAAGDVPVL